MFESGLIETAHAGYFPVCFCPLLQQASAQIPILAGDGSFGRFRSDNDRIPSVLEANPVTAGNVATLLCAESARIASA